MECTGARARSFAHSSSAIFRTTKHSPATRSANRASRYHSCVHVCIYTEIILRVHLARSIATGYEGERKAAREREGSEKRGARSSLKNPPPRILCDTRENETRARKIVMDFRGSGSESRGRDGINASSTAAASFNNARQIILCQGIIIRRAHGDESRRMFARRKSRFSRD